MSSVKDSLDRSHKLIMAAAAGPCNALERKRVSRSEIQHSIALLESAIKELQKVINA
jgi:hypothetical protein